MKKAVFRLPVIVMIIFIFTNSLTPSAASNSASLSITERIIPVLNAVHLDPSVDTLNFIIRKLAHFSEYALLGVLVMTAVSFAPTLWKKKELPVFFAVPLIDESLELITEGRSCEIRDMLIDSTGLLCGILLSGLFLSLMLQHQHKKQED